MTVDPTDPETIDETPEASGLDEETPEADAAEQAREVRERGDDPLTRVDPSVANPADAAEQTRVVEMDEDDYR